MKSRDEVIATLRQWLLTKKSALEPAALTEDLDLIASRTLESLEIVELVLLIERETGRPVLVERLDPEQLRTLRRIYQTFFEPRP